MECEKRFSRHMFCEKMENISTEMDARGNIKVVVSRYLSLPLHVEENHKHFGNKQKGGNSQTENWRNGQSIIITLKSMPNAKIANVCTVQNDYKIVLSRRTSEIRQSSGCL